MAPLDAHADATSCDSQLREALQGAASALKENGPRFALAGSYALWVYGAPEPSHDVDLVVAESDVETAVATLTNAGFVIERPPEDWLFKARTGDTLVDVLHRINGVPVDADDAGPRRTTATCWRSGCRCCRPPWCSSSSCALWASITATSPSCCRPCARCANGWTGSTSGPDRRQRLRGRVLGASRPAWPHLTRQ